MAAFIESSVLIGDALMQTPALRAYRAAHPGVEIVLVAEPGGLAEVALAGNPCVDRFASREAALAERSPEEPWIVLSPSDAQTYGLGHRVSMYDAFALQLDVHADSHTVDLVLTDEERRAGEALLDAVGPRHRVVVCGRHSTSCASNVVPGAPANKCFPNRVWCEVAEWLIGLGYVPLAVGSRAEEEDPRYAEWPGPKLYGQPIRTVAGLIESAKATFCVDTGLRFIAAATGCDLACVTGYVPTWLISCAPTHPAQTIIERFVPVSSVTATICKEMVWKVL